jgi:hypothetical protein
MARYSDTQYGYHSIWADIGSWLEKIVPPLSIIVAVLVFIYEERNENFRRKEDSTQMIIRSCNSISKELDDVEDAFNTSKYKHVTRPNEDPEEKIHYTQRFLITDAFMSISHSGLFTHFDSHTQNKLSNLYLRVTYFNSENKYMFELRDKYEFGTKTSDSKQYHDQPSSIYLP